MGEERGIKKDRVIALLEGLLVTFLWSTSYVLVKIGLQDLPPLTFAGYRYMIASLVLLTVLLVRQPRGRFTKQKDLPKLLLLGISGYTVAQGLQFVGLHFLPAVTVSFLLNFTPVLVLLFSIVLRRLFPTSLQLVGMILSLCGAYVFFLGPTSGTEFFGVPITLLSGAGWAIYLISTHKVMREERHDPFPFTAFSMFFGAVPLLILAFLIDGFLRISLQEWAIILWLSLVNTALAFILWNRVLKKIRAFELSVLQNTMLIQIALLASIFLGEELTTIKIVSLIMVFTGVLLVQIVKPKSP